MFSKSSVVKVDNVHIVFNNTKIKIDEVTIDISKFV